MEKFLIEFQSKIAKIPLVIHVFLDQIDLGNILTAPE